VADAGNRSPLRLDLFLHGGRYLEWHWRLGLVIGRARASTRGRATTIGLIEFQVVADLVEMVIEKLCASSYAPGPTESCVSG
jgi:hypothetical protein